MPIFNASLDHSLIFLFALQKDIQSMKECRHPNVVSYFCSFVVNSTVWIVMELMEEGKDEYLYL